MKINKTLTFEKAMIDCNDWTITEYLKDETLEHDLKAVFKEFDGVEGISLVIKQNEMGSEVKESEDKGDS